VVALSPDRASLWIFLVASHKREFSNLILFLLCSFDFLAFGIVLCHQHIYPYQDGLWVLLFRAKLCSVLGAVKLSGDVSFLNMLHHPKIEQNSTAHVTTVVRSRKSVDSVALGKLFVT
jgi:hypothetical protein